MNPATDPAPAAAPSRPGQALAPALQRRCLRLRRPDDGHLHLRDGAVMAAVLPSSARVFARAVVMPNLATPVTTVEQAQRYRERILAALPPALDFEPLMTLYLTAATVPGEIDRARASGIIHGVKLYPARATTLSDAGVSDWTQCTAVLARMERVDLPLLIHGELARPDADVFDRERLFLDAVLAPLQRAFPALRIVLEHVTTREAVQYVQAAPGRIAATITAHHLLYNRNAMFLGTDGSAGVRPYFYCLPVLKREEHRHALLAAATSGSPRFFLGSDSAPHARAQKESACGCAGCFTAPWALPMYAQAFEDAGALERLEDFASSYGAQFYGLARNAGTLLLERQAAATPAALYAEGHEYPPLAPQRCAWRVASEP